MADILTFRPRPRPAEPAPPPPLSEAEIRARIEAVAEAAMDTNVITVAAVALLDLFERAG